MLRLRTKSSILLLVFLSCTFIEGFPYYRDLIPNGQSVKHPCTGEIWAGVGHVSAAGGGFRNPFGDAFALGGRTWNEEFCRADSDQDGKTNGEELGDPNCTWKAGDTPSFNASSHPGICEPVESPECQAIQGVTCDDVPPPYDCPPSREPGVQSIELKFPETKVPAKETNYYCKVFKLPDDQPYHIVSVEPIIDNINVIHHMLLFGCTSDVEDTGVKECGMVAQECRALIGAWTIGIDGYCLQDEIGVAIGLGSYTSVSIQVHWNNPQLSPDYTDASGMRLFFTPVLRQFSERMAILGQRQIVVPPMIEETVVQGTCPASCTERRLPVPMNVTGALLHMHYLGMRGGVEVFRNGELKYTIIDDGYYDYEAPAKVEFNPPLVVMPGDEIVTKCIYNSKDGVRARTTTTYFGQATQDEMCFTFLNFYLQDPNLDIGFNCVQQGKVDLCDAQLGGPGDCDACTFYELAMQINENILGTGSCAQTCDDDCTETLSGRLLNSPCTQNVLAWLINNDIQIPEEFKAAADAFLLCLTSDTARGVTIDGKAILNGMLPAKNNFPKPSDCGLIEPPNSAATFSIAPIMLIMLISYFFN